MTDPYDLDVVVLDLRNGDELGRAPVGYGSDGTPLGMFLVGAKLYVLYPSRWLVVDVSDPTSPLLDHAIDQPAAYPLLSELADGTWLVGDGSQVFAFDPVTQAVLWGPIGLQYSSIQSLGDEQYLVSNNLGGATSLYERGSEAFTERLRVPDADLPTLSVTGEPGSGQRPLWIYSSDEGLTIRELHPTNGTTLELGPAVHSPLTLSLQRGSRHDGLLVLQIAEDGDTIDDGRIAIIDPETGAGGLLALDQLPLWSDAPWLNPWAVRVPPVRPSGLLLVEYSEWGTIDRLGLTPLSLDLDVDGALSRPRLRVYSLVR